jgi:hypothetical protein
LKEERAAGYQDVTKRTIEPKKAPKSEKGLGTAVKTTAMPH